MRAVLRCAALCIAVLAPVGGSDGSCCWLEETKIRVGPNSRGQGLTLKPEICRTASCFVSCLVMRAISTAGCECDAARRREEVGVSDAAAPRRRRLSKTNVYAGAWLAPRNVIAKGAWERDGPLEAGSYFAFAAADAAFRTADPGAFRALHLSAYEHSVVARSDFASAMRKVEAVVEWEVEKRCGGSAATGTFPLIGDTVAILPFYGGSVESKASTGNAHSAQPRRLKARALVANACALLFGVAARVVVYACAEVEGDAAAAAAALDGGLGPGARRAATVEAIRCGAPRKLPFVALKRALETTESSYLFYNEADQIIDFASATAANATAAFLARFPNALLTPHRWHKRYGSDPACGDACGTQPTGQNLCHLDTNVYAIARV